MLFFTAVIQLGITLFINNPLNCTYYTFKYKNMLRLATKIHRFSTEFYHPCTFKINPDNELNSACILALYFSYFRRYGHHYAKLDPLGIYNKTGEQFIRPTDIGISFQDSLDKFQFQASPIIKACKNIEEIENKLTQSYLGTSGVQFDHVDTVEEREWLYQQYQNLMISACTKEERLRLAKGLVEAEALDHFLHKKFVTFKRYSGQGAESTPVSLNELFSLAANNGFTDVVFGMPHRGRLNTLVNIMEYPASLLFRKIGGKTDTPSELFTILDDVVSHIAQSVEKDYNGNKIKITMVHNPSHLEAQNPVSMGKARSKMINHTKDDVLNIQVHGDSAICAQGIVYESMLLGRVPKYTVNGTIHIITNNQIGYTTRPIDSRSTKYASDVAKGFNIPIVHVNSENMEDVLRVLKLSIEYRKKYKKDFMIDLICYRKYGHNEVDEPEFTQPKMYHQIRKVHKPNPAKYAEKLQSEGLAKNLYDSTKTAMMQKYEKQFTEAKNIQKITLNDYMDQNRKGAKAFTHQWKGFKPTLLGEQYPTGFDVRLLKQFAKASVYIPSDFTIHARIKKYQIDERVKSIEANNLNWATCEALAFFSLNHQGYNIRFSGQDVERGTFSQRHINLIDQKTEEQFNSLDFFSKQAPGRGKVEFFNSPLTENGAMSFQYGYSIDNPLNFVCWQAQFGDFFNTAQVVIDTFLTNSEHKWMRQTGLTLILPHGFDGAGPEHSSCRMERFLQLANSDGGIEYYEPASGDKLNLLKIDDNKFYESYKTANFSLVNPTRPANMFHVLRRQMKRNFRSPLIVAGPKALLRHSGCHSKFEEMGSDSKFEEVLEYINADKIQKSKAIFLCSGKFVYDIQQLIKGAKSEQTSLITIQELFPFPQAKIEQILKKADKSAQVYWVQEENLNGGAYYFVERRISRILKRLGISKQLRYVGRRAIAAIAVGSSELHKKQSEELSNWIKKIIA